MLPAVRKSIAWSTDCTNYGAKHSSQQLPPGRPKGKIDHSPRHPPTSTFAIDPKQVFEHIQEIWKKGFEEIVQRICCLSFSPGGPPPTLLQIRFLKFKMSIFGIFRHFPKSTRDHPKRSPECVRACLAVRIG